VRAADEFEEELRAIGNDGIVNRREQRLQSARQRHLADRAGAARRLRLCERTTAEQACAHHDCQER
jgi:hypothetical protein